MQTKHGWQWKPFGILNHEHSRYKLSPKLPFFDPTAENFLGWARWHIKENINWRFASAFFVLLLSGTNMPPSHSCPMPRELQHSHTSNSPAATPLHGTHMAPTSHRALATQIAAAIPTFSIADCVPLLVTQYRSRILQLTDWPDTWQDFSAKHLHTPFATLAFSKPSAWTAWSRLRNFHTHAHTHTKFAVTIHRQQTWPCCEHGKGWSVVRWGW